MGQRKLALERLMSIKMKVTAAVLAATLATALGSTSIQAKGCGWGPSIGIGIAASTLIGAPAAGAYYYYDPVYRVSEHVAYGNYVDSMRVCNAVPS
jgi:hypothetical protein